MSLAYLIALWTAGAGSSLYIAFSDAPGWAKAFLVLIWAIVLMEGHARKLRMAGLHAATAIFEEKINFANGQIVELRSEQSLTAGAVRRMERERAF